MELSFKTPAELRQILGERLRVLRIDKGFGQEQLADKAGLSIGAVQKLEAGKGSTLDTLLRCLKALERLDLLDAIAPEPTISPLALLKAQARRPRRVSRRARGGET